MDGCWPPQNFFPRQLLIKLAPQPQNQKDQPPGGAAKTHPPTQPRSLLEQLVPSCTRAGHPLCRFVQEAHFIKKRSPQMRASSPRQVPLQESQTEQIKEKHKVMFKWHRGSREVARVPPRLGERQISG